MPDLVVKSAGKRDLAAVLSWLRREHEWTSLVSDGSFWHNRNIIERAQADKELYVLAAGRRIAGFLVGSLGGDLSIMEVRPELRGYGLGRQLVEHYLDRIREAGGLGACVDCEPPSSIPFWKRLGFRPYFDRRPTVPDDDSPFGRRSERLALILPIDCQMPATSPRVTVELAFVDPADRVPIVPPFTTEASHIGTEWRFAQPFCEYLGSADSYLLLTIDGEQVWIDKVKRINEIGGERDGGMTRLCRVVPPVRVDLPAPPGRAAPASQLP